MDISFEVQKRADSETCLKCRHCCEKEVLTIKDYDQLELAYHKGHRVMWDPSLEKWYLVLDWVCPHLKEDGCDIYDDPRRPTLCSTWECHKPGKMLQRIDILLVASNRICKQLFGERIDATTTSSGDWERSLWDGESCSCAGCPVPGLCNT
jgi:hypothetical protein